MTRSAPGTDDADTATQLLGRMGKCIHLGRSIKIGHNDQKRDPSKTDTIEKIQKKVYQNIQRSSELTGDAIHTSLSKSCQFFREWMGKINMSI